MAGIVMIMRKRKYVPRWVEITRDQTLFYKKTQGHQKVRQMMNLSDAKLEQGVERHLDENMKEVIDFRYFKLTGDVNGNQSSLLLRFDKYKDYREWGTVLLEATTSNKELLKKREDNMRE